ncbi:MAG: ABC transporter ATP-binding protein [Planctomycetaceae bacterium]|nr:ABC transporter ATP-binding protein [Planctomycetaceae bacterium]
MTTSADSPSRNGLVVSNLFKSYESAGASVSILRDLSLQLNPGDAASIVGPSGCGKSTLLYLISGLDRPDAGQISLFNHDILAASEIEQASIRNKLLGFIFQDHNLMPHLNVIENVLLPCLAGKGVNTQNRQLAQQLLDRVGLADRIEALPAQLSGGERQRVAVCRALINQPQLVLADEPTGNLDPETADVIGNLLLEISQEQQTTLICVTHSLELAARFPITFELQQGQLVNTKQSTAAH